MDTDVTGNALVQAASHDETTRDELPPQARSSTPNVAHVTRHDDGRSSHAADRPLRPWSAMLGPLALIGAIAATGAAPAVAIGILAIVALTLALAVRTRARGAATAVFYLAFFGIGTECVDQVLGGDPFSWPSAIVSGAVFASLMPIATKLVARAALEPPGGGRD